MISETVVPWWLIGLALSLAAVAVCYFLYVELRQDHETGEYHFTWGVAITSLVLMGVAPGLVGVGLYLAVERGYPLYWFVVATVAALVLVLVLGASVEVVTTPASVWPSLAAVP